MAGVLVALGACTAVTWQRPDTDAEQTRLDRAECRVIAAQQARRLTLHRHLLYQNRLFRWRHGRYVFDPDPFDDGPFDSPYYLRQDLAHQCLKAKGYSLVPAPAPP